MTEKWRPVQFLGLLSRKEVAPEQEGEQEAGVCLRSKFNSLGRSLHLGKGIGVESSVSRYPWNLES